MGATKKELFTEQQNTIATLAKAIGHPARVSIIDYLLKVESCICSDIVNELPLSQPTVSQHLRELKNAGIIQGEIEGNAICYCINGKALNVLRSYFGTVSNVLENKKKNCC